MINAKPFTTRSSSVPRFVLVVSIVAILAFSLGLLASPIARRFAQSPAALDTTNQAVAPMKAQSETKLVRVPYEMGWDLYDGGWAGGPPNIMARQPAVELSALQPYLITTIHGTARQHSSTALVRVPYEAGWELYDGGWAAGPAYKVPGLVRVPYEMGWDLYDGGWAGGPNTYPKGMAGQ